MLVDTRVGSLMHAYNKTKSIAAAGFHDQNVDWICGPKEYDDKQFGWIYDTMGSHNT